MSSCNSPRVLLSISTQEFYQKTQDSNNILLDVRTPQEFNEGHIENAQNIDYYNAQFKDQLNNLDKDQTYLIYCRSGSRSENTLNIMKDLGFTSVYDLDDGINDWKAKDLETIQ